MRDGDFLKWVEKAKQGKSELDRAGYLALERPSENVPVRRYAAVENGLYGAIVNMCVEPGKMCMSKMMAIDAKSDRGAPEEAAVPAARTAAEPPQPRASGAPLRGAGLPRPDFQPSRLATAAPADAQTRPTNS